MTDGRHSFVFVSFIKDYTTFYVVFSGYILETSYDLFVFNRWLEITFNIQDVSFIAVLNTVAVTGCPGRCRLPCNKAAVLLLLATLSS
jgi:hypothetical protein